MSTKKKEPPASALQATAAALTAMPDPDTLATARARIDAAAAVLTGFHRRHKNQHRVSTYWWPALGQLRRHVRRMSADLAETIKRPAKALKGGRHPAAARARWIRLHFVPRAYVAFSRLVADRRFAPLGLLLMGVLAEVHAVTRSLDLEGGDVAKDDIHNAASDSDSDSEDDTTAARPANKMAADTQPTYRATEPADVGVAVPRDEDGRPATKRARMDIDAGDEATTVAASSTAKKRKGERPDEDTDVSPGKSEKKEQKEKKEKGEKKEKKTKKKKRDEFDDLFSGLV